MNALIALKNFVMVKIIADFLKTDVKRTKKCKDF